MALFRSVYKLPLMEGKELHVVREDTNQTIIFSVVEDTTKAVRRRLTFEIPIKDAIKLARWMAGVTTLDKDE